jgi:prepilin-type processing-associated H-X9-DG protein
MVTRSPSVGSYGMNEQVLWEHARVPWGPEGKQAEWGWGLTDVRRAANIPIFVDCAVCRLDPFNECEEPPPYEGCFEFPYSRLSLCTLNRHNAAVNCLFLDWSIRKVGIKELWVLEWAPVWSTAGPWTKRGGVRPEDWPPWMRRFRDY